MKFYYAAVDKEACIALWRARAYWKSWAAATREELMLCMIKKTGLSKEGQERMKALIDSLSGKGDAKA